jgi:hypothetical protein
MFTAFSTQQLEVLRRGLRGARGLGSYTHDKVGKELLAHVESELTTRTDKTPVVIREFIVNNDYENGSI